MNYINYGMGWIIEKISQKMPLETDFTNPLGGSWYISPAQHGFEIILLSILFTCLFLYTLRKIINPDSKQWKLLAKYDYKKPVTFIECLLATLALASWILIVNYKYQRNQLIVLLQPCHFNLLVLTFILLFPKKYSITHLIYNVYVYGLWGTTLAIAQPDLRGYDYFFEAENFWIEHYLLLLAPVFLMFTERYVLWPPSLSVGLMSFCLNAFYNITFLALFALITGQNLNYMLSPPPGILQNFGKYYRTVMLGIAFIASFILRLTFVELGAFISLKIKAAWIRTKNQVTPVQVKKSN